MVRQRWYNRPIGWLLRSRFHRALSGSVLLLTYRGHRTGATHTTPLNYARDGDSLLVLSPRTHNWWRNLHEAQPVDVLLRGRRYHAIARALEGGAALAEAGPRALLRRLLRGPAAKQDARLLQIAEGYVVVRLDELHTAL
jgi:deazaflavin-dependent oxidoreductase (nitroreductase family)